MPLKKTPPTPMPSAVASPSVRDRPIALRATSTKLGPGLIAPIKSAASMPATAAKAVMGVLLEVNWKDPSSTKITWADRHREQLNQIIFTSGKRRSVHAQRWLL